MARYFFHVRDGSSLEDEDGVELAPHRVRAEAIDFAGAILREKAAHQWPEREWAVEVTDESSRVLFRLRILEEDLGSEASG